MERNLSRSLNGYAVRYYRRTVRDLKRMDPIRYIAVDVETTGLSCFNDRIVELSAVLFEDGQIRDEYTSLVNPQCHMNHHVIQIHGITNEMVKDAPDGSTMLKNWNEKMHWMDDPTIIFVAHNAAFDMGFLAQTMQRAGYRLSMQYVDSLALSRQLLNLPDYKLNTVANHYQISNPQAHRAYADALTCGKIMWQLIHESMV